MLALDAELTELTELTELAEELDSLELDIEGTFGSPTTFLILIGNWHNN